MLDKNFDNVKLSGKKFNYFKNIIEKEFNKKINEVVRIRMNRKVYRITFEDGQQIRLDIEFPDQTNRLQSLLSDKDVNIPKIIKIFKADKQTFKASEWISGILLYSVWDLAEVFYKSGELLAKMNLIQFENKFCTNTEFSSTNVVWTPDKKVYIIDQGKLVLTEYPDHYIMMILLKRIRNRERIEEFLKGYSNYRNIDEIRNSIEKKNWEWSSIKSLQLRAPLQF
jgi:hypothetical protein